MKTIARFLTLITALGMFALPGLSLAGPLPFKAVAVSSTMGQEEQELRSIYSAAQAAVQQVAPGESAGLQRSAIADELCGELAAFVADHTNSVWTPSVRLWLGRQAQRRAGYSEAMEQTALAWAALRESRDLRAFPMVRQGSGRLARLLALTGRLDDLDALEAQVRHQVGGRLGAHWAEAMELRGWVRRHPASAYRCGLQCLDQLGRLTQPGGFQSAELLRQTATTNGFSAAELVAIAGGAGMQVHAAMLINLTNFPVTCIVHLRGEHFVVLRERRGGFLDLYDPADAGPKWVTVSQLAAEATGCVIVSDAAGAPDASLYSTPLDAGTAAGFRGRLIGNGGHDDSPCNECGCPPGSAGGHGGHVDNIKAGDETGGASDTSAGGSGGKVITSCATCGYRPHFGRAGAPEWSVSEPFLSLWLTDLPIPYEAALGPDVALALAFNPRHQPGKVSDELWHGATFGNTVDGSSRQWGCSWLSFAELSTDGYTVDLLLPQGGWSTFTFASGATYSAMNFRHRLFLEKVSYGGTVTNLVVHHPDGALTSYGVKDTSDPTYGGLFYLSRQADAAGNTNTFTYTPGFLLTNVTAADGTSFTLHYDNATLPSYVTSVSAPYGATASFVYDTSSGVTDDGSLTNLTDAAGISSGLAYGNWGEVSSLVTPYGTTTFETEIVGSSVFDRIARITRADGLQEFYGQMNAYPGAENWPEFSGTQIPTNTPLGTLDTGARSNRNSFYWNAQQFEAFTGTALDAFDWAEFKRARIRHWLGSYATNALSWEQAPSPDGGTEGQVTWYDYAGKPANDECGAQVSPSVIARVMPDGSTAYQYFERLTNGHPTRAVDKWALGPAAQFRTNTFLYAANGTDLLAVTNALGVRVSSNHFNAYHQVATNHDALGQQTVFQYDGTTHQLTNVIRPSGLTNSYTYNANRRLQQTADQPINRTRSYT